jgi:hypothetical protein
VTDDNKTPRFKIGDIVWLAQYRTTERYVECSHCAGTGRIRVIFADDVEASIDCQNCAPGFDPPTGKVRVYDPHPHAQRSVVTGFTISGDGIEWQIDGPFYRTCEDEDVFATEEEALARAQVLSADAAKRSEEAVYQKEKNTRSWAWNASYHRNEIKRAKQQIEYHTKKLAVASLKAKEKVP